MLNPFEYHKPEGEAIERIERLRAAYWQLFQVIETETRPGKISGRYAALARTQLEESAMWATKSVVFEGNNAGPIEDQQKLDMLAALVRLKEHVNEPLIATAVDQVLAGNLPG